MGESEYSNHAELGFDELDVVAGGAAGADSAKVDGQVVEALPNAMFQVQLDNGISARCHLAGKLRQNFIRVLPGDRVCVETSPGNPSQGRIVWRYK